MWYLVFVSFNWTGNMNTKTRRNGRANRIQKTPEEMQVLYDAVESACEHGNLDYDRIVKKPRKDNRDPITGRRPRTEHTPEEMRHLKECARLVSLDSSKRLE